MAEAKTKKATSRKNKPIRIGLVGVGRAGWNMHCKELEPRKSKFQIVAACDKLAERRELIADQVGCRTYKTFDDLLKDDEVDLIDIASRSPDHVPQAIQALKAGFDVFLEKPIALTCTEARKLKTASARSKGSLYIRHNRRFEPCFQHVREIIDSGILGDVHEVKLRRLSYQRRDDWQTLIEFGGGQLLNWGPHIIDHGLRLLGAPLVELWSELKKIAAVGDAEDHLKVIMKGANGRLIDLEISGGSAIHEPVYIVKGSKGALKCDYEDKIQLKYLDPKKKLKPRRAKKSTPPFGGFGSKDELPWIEKTIKVAPKLKVDTWSIWDYLYDSIRKGKTFPISLDQALEVMDVIQRVKKGTPFEPGVKAGARTKKKKTSTRRSSRKA